MTWLERVVGMRAAGVRTEQDYEDAANCERCLVAEAAVVLGIRRLSNDKPDFIETNALLSSETGVPMVGGLFPVLIHANKFDKAEELCHKVADAVLRLKRERVDAIERVERNGWDEV